jgi:hypothetical protein
MQSPRDPLQPRVGVLAAQVRGSRCVHGGLLDLAAYVGERAGLLVGDPCDDAREIGGRSRSCRAFTLAVLAGCWGLFEVRSEVARLVADSLSEEAGGGSRA